MSRIFVALVAILVFVGVSFCGNWPQWHGANRDNISGETGLLDVWPDGGPRQVWSVDGIGKGYSTVSIADGFIYITGMHTKKEGVVSKLTLDGKLVWQKPYGAEWYSNFASSRTTPTINDGFAYIMSGLGGVVCIDIETGETKWSVNTFAKFGGKPPFFGVAESLVVDGSKVYCQAGGKDASVVALNKKTGEVVWVTKGLSEKVCFCSAILVDHHGKKQLITVLEKSVVGIDIADGKLLWSCLKESFCNPDGDRRGKGSCTNTPIYKDGRVFVTTGYDQGSALIRISDDSKTATVVWKNYELDNHHGSVILRDGHLYGSSWDGNTKGDWLCLDWETGKTLYTHSWDKKKGSLTYADGMLYCYAEKTGNFALVKADPSKFSIAGLFTVTEGKGEHWAHPVVLDGRLYVRHGDVLMAYDVKE